MSPSHVSLDELIEAARRLVRRDVTLAVAGAVLITVPLVLVAAWLMAGQTGWLAPSPAPLALETLALGAAAVVFWRFRRNWMLGTGERDLAATAETGAGLAPGAVLGVLELRRGVPSGTSAALFQREESIVSGHFAGRSAGQVTGDVGRRARQRRGAMLGALLGATGLAGILGFVSPERVHNAWTPLLHPIAHLSSPPLPALQVQPGDAEVLRGADLPVRIQAPGRYAITLSWRAEGDVLHRQTVPVMGDSAIALVQRVDARTEYWIEAPDGARTRTFVITPRDPLLVTELTVVVRYPAHVGRAPDRYSTEVPPLELPEGSTLLIEGRATRVLASAALDGDAGGTFTLGVSEDGFTGSWTPSASGVYEWRIRGRDGSDLMTSPAPLEIALIADSPPVVEVTYPGRDTLVDPTRIHTIAGDARDDYGVASATMVHWRIGADGRAEPPSETPFLIEGTADRVLVRGVLDLREMDLIPGDTIKYFVRVADNSPRSQTAVSRTYALYLPGAGDLRDRVTEEAQDMVQRAEELARNAKQLQDETKTLQRRTEASNARRSDSATRTGNNQGTTGQTPPLGFRESEQARRILEEQQKLMEGLEEMQKRIEAAQRAMEEAGLRDPATEKKLQELRELYEQMLTPEMQQQMEALEQALEKLDPEALQKALEQLMQKQQDLREKLDESLEQLQRAADEQRANALAQETRELATQQQALAESMRERPANAQDAETQRQLEQKAKDLAAEVEQLSRDLQEHKTDEAATKAGDASQQIEQARQDMNRAASQAQQKQGEDAAKSAQQAAEKLEKAAQSLDASRDQMSNAAEREMREAMEQATNEALSLAQKQQALKDRMEQMQQGQPQQQGQQGQQQQDQKGQRGQQQGQQQQGQQGQQQGQQQGGQQGGSDLQRMREEQAALEQGLEQLGRNLAQAAEQAGSMSKDVGASLGRANLSMQQTMQAMQKAQDGKSMPTQEAAQTVEALNRLALSLLNSQQNQQQQQQGAEQAMQQLSDIAQQQGQLNGRSNALLPMQLPQQAMTQQMNRIAQDQREIASQIEDANKKLAGRDDVLGKLDELAAEAERLAREMEGGRLPADVLARQERLFHRLLDAGRTLERDEVSEERVAERPGQYIPSVAPPLDAALLDSSVRYRVPTPEELKNLPPAYRKMILDYFERINRTQAGEKKQR